MKLAFTLVCLVSLLVTGIAGCTGQDTLSKPYSSTPSPTLSPSGIPRYTKAEAISLVANWLLSQAKTRVAQDVVEDEVNRFQASYQGSGVWEITGNGKWRVFEGSGIVQAVDANAFEVTKSIADANQAVPTPTPFAVPTPAPFPSASPTPGLERPLVQPPTLSFPYPTYRPPPVSRPGVNPNQIWIEGYYRKDGTYVRGHWRTLPNDTTADNIRP